MTNLTIAASIVLILLSGAALAQDTLVFEAEDYSSPNDAWENDITPKTTWNLWSKDKDAESKWSGGIVLQSPPVMADRATPEEGAPVLHTLITGIPAGRWDVRIKYGRGLAVSLDGKQWRRASLIGGSLGRFEITDGTFELWVDDRFADPDHPGFTYYDCLYFAAAMPEETGVRNGDFEAGGEMPGSAWAWFSREKVGGPEFAAEAHGGKRCVKIQHDGERDWALSNSGRLDVEGGQLWTASAWIKCRDTDGIDLAIVALADGRTLRWSIGDDGVQGTRDWTKVQATALIPPDCDQIYVRFFGSRNTLAWVDDVTLRKGEAPPKHPPKPQITGWATERVWEEIGRGMLAMPIEGGKVYVGWRLLADDPEDIAFNVYRATGRMRPVKLTEKPITATTDFVDESPPLDHDNMYWVRPVIDGKELDPSDTTRIGPNPEPKPYISIKLQAEDATFQKAGIADLDGDGRYDYVIKLPNTNIDPWHVYWTPSPDTYKIEAYLNDGTFLWRNDLGWAIERGIWYSPYVVWDFDGDGKAEVAVKTGEGDPREEDGKVREGAEYVSIWDGMTGKEIARADWPSRDGFTGSRGYNLASRNQMGVAYLDGKTPCLLLARGTYRTMKLAAYQYRDRKLEKLWEWDSRDQSRTWRGQGAHFMHAADVDGDGRDEVMLGSCVIDDNGDGLWTNGKGHCDHCYLGDIDPSRPGLEVYFGYETPQSSKGCCLADAKTGEIIWGITERTYHVHASGLCADFDPLHPGMECYSGEKEVPEDKPRRWLHTAKGELLANEQTWDVGLSPRAVYWDADPQRELLRGNRIYDYQGKTHTDQIDGRHSTWGDILGDWREEIIATVPGELRIYTTTIPAADRRVCLMQDPIHRIDVAHLAMGYPQPPMTSFCIGGPGATMGFRIPTADIKPGEAIAGRLILVPPEGEGITGTIELHADNGAVVEPSTVEVEVAAGGTAQVQFEVTVPEPKEALIAGPRSLSITARFLGGERTMEAQADLRLADRPLTETPMTQAEDFCAQGGGEVHLRDDKIGAVGASISHWDDEGHWLEWRINAPEEGEYIVAVRYCTPTNAHRRVDIDTQPHFATRFPATGGFASSTNDWAHAPLIAVDGKPLALKLTAGEHTIKLTNVDGEGINVDYIALLRAD